MHTAVTHAAMVLGVHAQGVMQSSWLFELIRRCGKLRNKLTAGHQHADSQWGALSLPSELK
jgi:hypothetical protein